MIRRRKKHSNDVSNHERWMVSYADFVTLLFAFFVVMYSISSVNEEKYKTFSNSLEKAFYEKSRKKTETDSMQLMTPPAEPQALPAANPIPEDNVKGVDLAEEKKQLQHASEQLTVALKPLIDENMVAIKRKGYWIELELSSGLLFMSGDAELAANSKSLIKEIAKVFKPLPNAINVEGHTDNNPINTLKFPSNWELSSARATRVVQEFIKEGINPDRLSAIGYGQYHPIADNETENGRFKNRRVVLLLVSRGFSRYGASDQERASLLTQLPESGIIEPAK